MLKVRNVVLLVGVVTAFSGLALADYYLRNESVGRTRRELKEQGVDLSVESLIAAVRHDDHKKVAALLQVGVDPGAVGAAGETALLAAVAAGSERWVEELLSYQRVLTTLDLVTPEGGSGLSALGRALQAEEFGIAGQLIGAGAKWPDVLDGEEPLVIAAYRGDQRDLFDFLLQHQREIDQRGADGKTGLVLAVEENKQQWVAAFLAAGAGVNQLGDDGQPLLLEVAAAGEMKILELFIDHGADLDQTNKKGETALMLAAGLKDGGIFERLLQAGAALGGEDAGGSTVVDRLIENGDELRLQLLVKNKGSKVADDWMLKVYQANQIELAGRLLHWGGNVEAGKKSAAGSLLKRAVSEQKITWVRQLLSWKADAQGLLWTALALGDREVVEVLLAAGADANEQLVVGVGSPLSLALRQQRYDLARVLLDHGAEPDPQQSDGLRLLEKIEAKGDQEAAVLLREYCAGYQEESMEAPQSIESMDLIESMKNKASP
ncbi:MAG: ankyrin repeat domain-containing protein [Verrucomicrobiota bacterium]